MSSICSFFLQPKLFGFEKNLGAGMFMSPDMEHGMTGYTEPLRRFIQPEGYAPQVNEIKNQMPSWLPGEDYLVNFQKGDPYIKVEEGYARLPGAGYEALHPELEGVDPEGYPDIARMRILADVAPYSSEYQKHAGLVRSQANHDPDLKVEYERIAEQVRQTKDSTLQIAQRHFNAPVDIIAGITPGAFPPSQNTTPRARGQASAQTSRPAKAHRQAGHPVPGGQTPHYPVKPLRERYWDAGPVINLRDQCQRSMSAISQSSRLSISLSIHCSGDLFPNLVMQDLDPSQEGFSGPAKACFAPRAGRQSS